MNWTVARDELVTAAPVSPLETGVVASSGIYAWWDTRSALASRWPHAFPLVDSSRPLYVGVAAKQSLSSRVVETHLLTTRRSALRCSLSALLSEPLELLPGAVRHPRGGKFGLEKSQESRLTEWMVTNLRVTWVEHSEPGSVEKPIIRDTLPTLNFTYATGSPYRARMKALRMEFRASAPLVWESKDSRAIY
ncbi:GIY-YIG nuclease family protein [Conyzicola nivalis]|uniref:GIY-YIG nuclease family protein n=1 Tax=Conyzicola nivalis TaxID=1477021 RepID=UPI003570E355